MATYNQKKAVRFIGKKIRMTSFFDENGSQVVCTVIEARPHTVCRLVSEEGDLTKALVGGSPILPAKAHKVRKPQRQFFAKIGVNPCRRLFETFLPTEKAEVGSFLLPWEWLETSDFLDITGRSKGKGHQGVMRRHGMHGGPKSHGSGFHRHGGSCGMRSTPGRCLPGQKKSGRDGNKRVTVQRLKVVKIHRESGLIYVMGSIPGPSGGELFFTKSKKVKLKKAV